MKFTQPCQLNKAAGMMLLRMQAYEFVPATVSQQPKPKFSDIYRVCMRKRSLA